jgi:hypothetical protein
MAHAIPKSREGANLLIIKPLGIEGQQIPDHYAVHSKKAAACSGYTCAQSLPRNQTVQHWGGLPFHTPSKSLLACLFLFDLPLRRCYSHLSLLCPRARKTGLVDCWAVPVHRDCIEFFRCQHEFEGQQSRGRAQHHQVTCLKTLY